MFAGDAIDANEMCQCCCGDDVSCGIPERELCKLNQEAAHLNLLCFVLTLSHMVLFSSSGHSLGGFRLCGQFWQMSVANVVVFISTSKMFSSGFSCIFFSDDLIRNLAHDVRSGKRHGANN